MYILCPYTRFRLKRTFYMACIKKDLIIDGPSHLREFTKRTFLTSDSGAEICAPEIFYWYSGSSVWRDNYGILLDYAWYCPFMAYSSHWIVAPVSRCAHPQFSIIAHIIVRRCINTIFVEKLDRANVAHLDKHCTKWSYNYHSIYTLAQMHDRLRDAGTIRLDPLPC
jgi:hypothetical protein